MLINAIMGMTIEAGETEYMKMTIDPSYHRQSPTTTPKNTRGNTKHLKSHMCCGGSSSKD